MLWGSDLPHRCLPLQVLYYYGMQAGLKLFLWIITSKINSNTIFHLPLWGHPYLSSIASTHVLLHHGLCTILSHSVSSSIAWMITHSMRVTIFCFKFAGSQGEKGYLLWFCLYMGWHPPYKPCCCRSCPLYGCG